jgi:SAM-dependent methyltransferase
MHADDIRGRVLEVGENRYASRFGSAIALESVDILDVGRANDRATVILDLGKDEPAPDGPRFDCVICTQTLLLVYDVHAAMRNLHGLLGPGGVLLLTVPGVSQICRDEDRRWEDYWRFTGRSVQRLCEEAFPAERIVVEAFGNVLSAASFLYGLACEELRRSELELRDPDYEVVIAARAQRD